MSLKYSIKALDSSQYFFQIHSLQLLIFCMDDQEFAANLDYVLFRFIL